MSGGGDVPGGVTPANTAKLTAALKTYPDAKIQTETFEPNITLLDYQPDIFVVVLVDPADGQREIATKRYFP